MRSRFFSEQFKIGYVTVPQCPPPREDGRLLYNRCPAAWTLLSSSGDWLLENRQVQMADQITSDICMRGGEKAKRNMPQDFLDSQ